MILSNSKLGRRVDQFVERFETARARDADVELSAFLPERSDPEFASVAVELMRVDLECRWDRGTPIRLQHYREAYGELLSDPAALGELAYEEYRLRVQSGEAVEPTEYVERYRIDTTTWPQTDAPLDLGSTTRSLASVTPDLVRLADAVQPFPEIGEAFDSFHILQQIGQGAFGRVYLASQGDLASRRVVLKITTTRSLEPDRLARLQHTNIVPIYSIHQHDSLYAICMPLLGTTTLADAIRLRRRAKALPASGEFFRQLLQDRPPCASANDPKTTSAPVLASNLTQLASLSYENACLALAADVAEALAHAHDRGIVHRDLKPANLLLTDEGRPMLLDFNIADDAVAGGPICLCMGGTLPYMAPEQLRALETREGIDARGDVYSFGVVLFELLTGHLPPGFAATGEALEGLVAAGDGNGTRGRAFDVAPLVQARTQANTDVRQYEPAISADVASIVAHCLAADPRERYQSMHDVREDLLRHQQDQPLRHAPNTSWRERCDKWWRRHPRLCSLTSLAVAAALIVALAAATLVVQQRTVRRVMSQQTLGSLEQSLPQLRVMLSSPHSDPQTLQQGQLLARDLLSGLGLGETLAAAQSARPIDPQAGTDVTAPLLALSRWLGPDEQRRLRVGTAEVLYLLAAAEAKLIRGTGDGNETQPTQEPWRTAARMNRLAIDLFAGDLQSLPAALRLQQTWLQQSLDGNSADVGELAFVDRLPLRAQANDYLSALELMRQGRPLAAIPLLQRMRHDYPHDFSAWLLLGDAYLLVGDPDEAKSCYDGCVSLWPDSPLCFFHRGVYHLEQEQYVAAVTDFDQTLRLQADHTGALLNRALALLQLERYAEAERDFTAALDRGAQQTRIYFLRAQARAGQGDESSAAQDRAEAMRRPPTDPVSCLVRGNAVLRHDPDEALVWYRRALQLDPASRMALRNLAHVLAERQGDTAAAIRVVDRLVEQFGHRPEDLVSRGVLHARAGDRQAALADAQSALAGRQDGKLLFQVACIHALCAGQNPEDAEQAIQLVGQAIVKDPRWLQVAMRDPDLVSLRNQEKFRELIRAAATMQHVIKSVGTLNTEDTQAE